MKKCADKPCKNCPWKKASKAGGADIPNFDMDLMRNLKNTVPARGSEQDGFFNIFACHDSPVGGEYACAGYIARHGLQNINVRLMATVGGVNISKALDCADTHDLYPDFWTMLDEYEAANEQG
ncbi:DUF6283 family protein [Pseudoalteromonas sp. Of7M-16]|uniref:DUF6283 family protein n=1 Tax=Pseudoalteromonas sp. Of7M-16 TaxID=2917756 RepID=UPI001EF477C9|nr:DUF6283 family protein [Pseudoalteromonas sp. Of7M-16]MCG7550889.1 DUF6283 family protein [Pseudoalteromonas sp. Of7M-16]